MDFFEYTFASIIGALTSAVPPDNCFEKEREEVFIFDVAVSVVVASIATEAAVSGIEKCWLFLVCHLRSNHVCLVLFCFLSFCCLFI